MKFNYFSKFLNIYSVKILRHIKFKKITRQKKLTIIRKITAEQLKNERQQIKDLKKFGKKILKKLKYQILITKNFNNYLKTNNKVFIYLNFIS